MKNELYLLLWCIHNSTWNICFLSTCIILISGVATSTNITLGSPLFVQSSVLLASQTLIFGILLSSLAPLFIMFSWNYFLVYDLYSYKLKIIILIFSYAWFSFSLFYTKKENLTSFEYWVLALLSVTAILLVSQACDLLSMYLAIEFQSLTFYILTSYKRTSEFSTEAGLKYFILGAFSSSFLLFGSSLLYSLTGLTNFEDFDKFTTGFAANNLLITNGILTSLTFILVALLFKIGAAPFHMWSPDVYEGAPISTTAFLVILPKISLIILFIRFFVITFQDYFLITEKIILLSSLISLFVGAFGALSQKKWKRFIAYSSINHIGFMLLALSTGNKSSVFTILFYLIIYIFTMLNIFSWIISYRWKTYLTNYQIRYLVNLRSLNVINPILALTLALTLFSMAGIPPLAGFFSKMFVLLNILKNEIYGLTIVAVIISCLTCFYYIQLIKLMYFSQSSRLFILYPISKINSLVLAVSFYFLGLIFLDFELASLFLENLTDHS
uniref:NADH dehydrogenase subunit 2 n=1 Tax=Hildenbrandia rubra TaxID=31481 RepID=A0A0A7A7B1_9FLOR|nr:NADH dehydrogenase subunit 2 [Hildenbrandia rubra]AHB62137.1 NADH dehydrogenase subunit 2 [Hildenbrandia rubra]